MIKVKVSLYKGFKEGIDEYLDSRVIENINRLERCFVPAVDEMLKSHGLQRSPCVKARGPIEGSIHIDFGSHPYYLDIRPANNSEEE